MSAPSTDVWCLNFDDWLHDPAWRIPVCERFSWLLIRANAARGRWMEWKVRATKTISRQNPQLFVTHFFVRETSRKCNQYQFVFSLAASAHRQWCTPVQRSQASAHYHSMERGTANKGDPDERERERERGNVLTVEAMNTPFCFRNNVWVEVVVVLLSCSSHARNESKHKRSCSTLIPCSLFSSSSRYLPSKSTVLLHGTSCICGIRIVWVTLAPLWKIMRGGIHSCRFSTRTKMDARNSRVRITIKWWSAMASDSATTIFVDFRVVVSSRSFSSQKQE